MLWLVPLVFALALMVPVALVPFSTRASLLVSRVGVPVFGFYVTNESPRRARQINRLRAAHVGTTQRVYAARTLLMAALMGVAGSVVGVYAAGWVLSLLSVDAETIESALPAVLSVLAGLAQLSEVGLLQLFVLLVVSGGTVGSAAALGTYWVRWAYLDQKATARGSEIDASLPRTAAFIYALSRSGMSFPEVLETMTENRDVYGEAAREVGVAVRDMDAFGTDVLTALHEMSNRTPSDGLSEFGENLASVLGSGRSLSNFLREQYERFQEEAEALQQQYLELLATFAEIYVTVLVAGPLFFITVLVVVGLVLQDTLPLIRVVTYLGIPLGTFAFVVYMDSLTEDVIDSGSGADLTESDPPRASPTTRSRQATVQADGGASIDSTTALDTRNRERLEAYDRFGWLRLWMTDPVSQLVSNPVATLLATVPLALAWLVYRVGSIDEVIATGFASLSGPLIPSPTGFVATIDGPLIEATVIVFSVAAAVYEIRKRRVRDIEAAVPDWLERMASVNEAGLTVRESLKRVSGGDLDVLTEELNRTRRDLEWGATAQTALYRLDRRVQSGMVSRAVTLITNSMSASGDISPVLRIAANEAQNTRRLRRERKQEMLTYLFVIYISFAVFLGIIVALTVAFIPAIEQAAGTATAGGTSQLPTGSIFSGLRDVQPDAYELLFFHVVSIQGVCSGLVAGQLGEGRVADGLKHATVMLLATYLVFTFI